jgi:type IX secretion system PorP/SprF family membrane protein
MRTIQIIIILLALNVKGLLGQDVQFSQFYSNAMYLAPSFAGLTENNRLYLTYRNQWPGIQTGYQTFAASVDHYFSNMNSGLGVLFYTDIAGSGNLQTLSIGIQYSYNIKIKNTLYVRPGMHFSYQERSIDFNSLLWGDQMSAVGNADATGEIISFDKVGDIDFALSGLIYNKDFWFGISADHLLRPNHSLYDYENEEENEGLIPVKYQVFGGTKYTVRQNLLRPVPTTLQLAFLFRSQYIYNQLDLGFYWHHSPLVLGFWYRGVPVVKSFHYNDAFTILVGYKLRQISIGYSYDFTVSRLITSSGGAHEISLAYTFKNIEKRRRPKKMVPCPDF